ncbi:MAG TPA: two-component system response regulator [Solibacterales bacterium]|nr:two-component system response regulator [Bryobacterales bacterium]
MSHSRPGRILVIDDQEANLRLLRRILTEAGYRTVRTVSDPRLALDEFAAFEPDVVLLDLMMPFVDGFELLEEIKRRLPQDEYLPVLVVTADQAPQSRQKALAAGASDFLTKPIEVTETLLRIRNQLETRSLHRQLRHQNGQLEEKVRQRTVELEQAKYEILERLALAAEFRDDDTGQHTRRVGVLAGMLAETLGLESDRVHLIAQAAPLHDIGKIGIPDQILLKAGPLTQAEFALMKTHTRIGAKILAGSRFPLLKTAEVIARFHHERWDGAGYEGLVGEEIPLEGRIVAVADAFDALTHKRPYKPAWTLEQALGEIRQRAGTQFDPSLASAIQELSVAGLRSLIAATGSPAVPAVMPIESGQ